MTKQLLTINIKLVLVLNIQIQNIEHLNCACQCLCKLSFITHLREPEIQLFNSSLPRNCVSHHRCKLQKTLAEFLLLILSELFFCTRVQLPLNRRNHSVRPTKTRLERVSHASALFHTLTNPNVRFTRLRPAFSSNSLFLLFLNV